MTQAQKTAKAKFKQAIAYRTKTGVSLKEAFAHIYGKKKAVKKAAPKKKVVKKAAKKRIAGPKDSKLVKKELAKKGLKMPHGYATVKRKRKISGVKKKPTETQVLKSIQKAVSTQKKHMIGMNNYPIRFTRINNDVNGNPRYAIHFLDLINSEENLFLPFAKKYEYALKKAKKIGGKKYDNKQYGGGIVFQSYNINDLEKKILSLKHTTPKIKI